MRSSYVIRECQSTDIDHVLQLWFDSDDLGGSTNEKSSLEAKLCVEDGLFLVAEREGRIVGTVIGGWDGWRGSLYRLVVGQSHRRQGVGSQLVERTLARLKSLGATRVYALVQVETHSPVAVPFWVSQGFIPADSVNPYVLKL